MNGSVGSKASPAACEPLEVVRRLYDAWNAGDVAGAAALLSPAVRWGIVPPVASRRRATGAASNARGRLVGRDLQAVAGDGRPARVCGRPRDRLQPRSGPHGEAEAERLEVWTLRDGKVVHYRGYGLDAGLAVLSETTGSRRPEAVCRGVLALNRGDVDGWVRLFDPDVEFVSAEQHVRRGHAGMRAYVEELGTLWPGQRLDDVRILAETANALVISAVQHLDDASRGLRVTEPLNLVIAFEGDRARRVAGHATPEEALSPAAGQGA